MFACSGTVFLAHGLLLKNAQNPMQAQSELVTSLKIDSVTRVDAVCI